MKNIWKIVKVSKSLHKQFGILAVLILVHAAIQQVTPLMFKLIVDEIQQQLSSGTGDVQRLFLLLGITFVMNLISISLEAVNQRKGDWAGARLGKRLTERFYAKIFTLPQKYFDSEISGKIVHQLTRGINSIRDFVNSGTNFIIPAILQTIFTLGILAYFNWKIALLAFLIYPIYIYISHYSTKKWGEKEIKKNMIEDTVRARIQEVISNIKLVRGYNNQIRETEFVSVNLEDSNQLYDKQSRTYHLLNYLRNFGLETILVIISFIVFYDTYTGTITIGSMVLILELLNRMRRPLFAMSFILERIQRAESGSKEFFEILELKSVEEYATQKAKLIKFEKPSIEFKNVNFSYQESDQVLKDVNFTLNKKETVALVGHSGAGKTTVINLIMKYYQPDSGEILLGGQSYTKLAHETIRNNISLVFQESELFASTVKENITYGIPKASNKTITTALKKANAYDFVMKLSNGVDSEIGERGVKLSGGQKQRIQIARAIIHNNPILILDEATSNLDARSEKTVQDALEELIKDKLVIIIAHRFSTLRNADRIVVLDEGRVIDQGSPKQLAQKDGIYAELLRYQVEGNKELLKEYELS